MKYILILAAAATMISCTRKVEQQEEVQNTETVDTVQLETTDSVN